MQPRCDLYRVGRSELGPRMTQTLTQWSSSRLSGSKRVQVFDPSGGLLFALGSLGSGEATIHELLRHLRSCGFEGVPRPEFPSALDDALMVGRRFVESQVDLGHPGFIEMWETRWTKTG